MLESAAIPVLLYHSVDSRFTNAYRHLVCLPDEFEQHIRIIAETGFHPISMSSLVSAILHHDALPARPVVLTFDDGLRDFLTGALPILRRYNFPATLFVVSGYVSRTSRWLAFVGEGDRPMLNWDELREVAAAGIEIGAHSHSHAQLDIASTESAFEEIYRSKCTIEDQLGLGIRSFAYPYGFANRTTRRLTRRAGFLSACRVRNALSSIREDLFGISRIVMTSDINQHTLVNFLNGTGLPVSPRAETVAELGFRVARRLGLWRHNQWFTGPSGLGRQHPLSTN